MQIRLCLIYSQPFLVTFFIRIYFCNLFISFLFPFQKYETETFSFGLIQQPPLFFISHLQIVNDNLMLKVIKCLLSLLGILFFYVQCVRLETSHCLVTLSPVILFCSSKKQSNINHAKISQFIDRNRLMVLHLLIEIYQSFVTHETMVCPTLSLH